MSAGISIVIIVLMVCAMVLLLRGQTARRSAAPDSGLMVEYRTDLPLDECIDIMRAPQEDDVFLYTFDREKDGGFALHFTQHRATEQPIDTVYSLRLESGRQTILSLVFIREAFGYKEPVFPIALLDEFFTAKLSATRQ